MTDQTAALAALARIRQMADHWEQQLPDVIRTPAVVSALRAVFDRVPAVPLPPADHCPTPETHNWGCGCPSDVAAAIASCPGRELSPSPCRCPCYGCKHHCGAHNPETMPPADQTALRDRIAEAALAAVEAALGDTLVPAARAEALAGITTVLPATTNHDTAAAGPKALREAADFFERTLEHSLDPGSDPRYCTAVRDVVMGLRRRADEGPLSSYYEHPACGFRWHGRDGMDIPTRDGQPVCPRCELRRVADETAATEHQPRRGDQVEAWLKQERDEWAPAGCQPWQVTDTLLNQYRLHADTGTPLGHHVCETLAVEDCDCLEQPATAAQQDEEQPASDGPYRRLLAALETEHARAQKSAGHAREEQVGLTATGLASGFLHAAAMTVREFEGPEAAQAYAQQAIATKENPMTYPQLLTPEEKLEIAKECLNIPRIVAICGSTRFMDLMAEADLRETANGHIVVKPGCNMKQPHPLWNNPADAEVLKARLDDLHRAKIRLADEILVIGDYIGDSTRAEIAYARSLGKPVRFTHPEVDPAGTEA